MAYDSSSLTTEYTWTFSIKLYKVGGKMATGSFSFLDLEKELDKFAEKQSLCK